MGLTLQFKDLEDIVYDFGTNNYTVDKSGTQELDLTYNYNKINGSFKEIIMPNYRVNYGNSSLKEKTTLFFEFDQESVEMHFTLNGMSTTSINHILAPYTMQTNTHNIFYCNDIKGNLDLFSSQVDVFEINLNPSFFIKYLPEGGMFNQFKRIIQNKEIGFLHKNAYPIIPQMHFIIQDIIHCQWKDSYRQLYLDSKILELLLLQIQQISTFDLNRGHQETSKVIIRKMHDAKDIIEGKLNNPLSLTVLARAVNTNIGTLKKEFKNVFGTTVFGYISDLKMEEAKNILLNQQLSITEVSEKIGYKNPQHFSTAFKRKFGVSPSVLRK